jgi:AcrR family transcriptional regulator
MDRNDEDEDKAMPSRREQSRVREAILDHVARCLGDLGYAGTTFELIRNRAALSDAGLHACFPEGRDGMVCEAFIRTGEAVRVRAERLRDEAVDIAGRITALGVALVEIASTPTGRFYCLPTLGIPWNIVATVERTWAPFEELVKRDLAEASTWGQLPADAPVDDLSSCLTGAIRAAGATTARGLQPPYDQIAAISLLVRSLLTRHGATSPSPSVSSRAEV